MTIVDARTLTYEQMVNFKNKRPVSFVADISSVEGKIQDYELVKIISITDLGMEKIWENDSSQVCTVVFNDCEPLDINFVPEPNSIWMKDEDAKKIVDFIEETHALKEKVLMLVNCKFGMARSGAVVDFIGMTCGLGYWNTRRRNPQIVPNHWNQYLLAKEHFRRVFNKEQP